ncbi:MAG: hypothetical protein ACXW20_06030 [Burkholderiales bacterium]
MDGDDVRMRDPPLQRHELVGSADVPRVEPPFVWSVSQQYPALPMVEGYPYLGGSDTRNSEQDAMADFLIGIDLMLYAAACASVLFTTVLVLGS